MNIQSLSGRVSLTTLLAVGVMFSACVRSPEAKSAAYIESGKKQLAKNDAKRAILEFRNAVKATPNNAEAYYQLSLGYFASGDLTSGIVSLRKTLQLNPKHRPAQLRMAQLMAMASDPALVREAQDRLKKMVDGGSADPDTLHALAFAQLKLDEPQEAVENLGRAMALAPQDLMLAVSMADAKVREHDINGAEAVLKKASQDSPKSAQAAFFLGRFYGSQNRWTEAEQQFNRALSIDSRNADALYNLALLQNRTGRKQEAEQNFKRLSELPGKTFNSIHAIFLFQEGRRDDAIREFEALAKADPEDRQARARLIAAYRAANRPADAQKVLDAALQRNPQDADALLQRGETFIASKRFDLAERDLNQVIHLNPDSAQAHYVMAKFHQARGESLTYREELQKALQLSPSLIALRIEAAQTLIAANDAQGALALLDQAPASQKAMTALLVERNWSLWALGNFAEMRKGIDLGLSRERNTELLLQDGIWKLHAGEYAPARKSLEEALNINPGDVRALQVLNTSYTDQKQASVALAKVKEFAARQPKAAPVQEFLGTLLVANGQQQEARVAFESARSADPGYTRANLSLTQLDVVDGRWNDARKRLGGVLAADQSNTTARLWLGNIEAVQGNLNAATQDFQQVVAADPGNAQALNNYAYLLARSDNQLTEALKYAQKAKELSPGKAEYADTLGWILYRQGLYTSAVRELTSAVNSVGNPVWKYHLAMAYAKAGDLRRGRDTLQAALKMSPDAPEAKMAQAVLAAAAKP